MKTLIFAAALLFATSTMAQQQGQNPTAPPQGTPPFVQSEPNDQMPPDTHAPAHQELSTTEVQKQIQNKISDEPGLAGSNVSVNVDDRSVTLTGTVNSEQQHDLALGIARSLAGDRPIDDKIALRSQT